MRDAPRRNISGASERNARGSGGGDNDDERRTKSAAGRRLNYIGHLSASSYVYEESGTCAALFVYTLSPNATD